ncbi:MAG: DUF1311 domain-containing protein [Verrucomicrobia bacterium]|nr:DUF1311 domain-containing protein [Verrucomicrobiota bacterium]
MDERLNEVYLSLRARLSPARREQLRESEREFLNDRDRCRENPDLYFQRTEEQITSLEERLNALQ